MEKKSFFAGMATRLFTAVVMVLLTGVFNASCVDKREDEVMTKRSAPTPTPDPDPETKVVYDFKVSCQQIAANERNHNCSFTNQFFQNDQLVNEQRGNLKANYKLSIDRDTVRTLKGDPAPTMTSKGQSEPTFDGYTMNQTHTYVMSNGCILTLKVAAQHGKVSWNGYQYSCGHDSIIETRVLDTKTVKEVLTRATSVPAQYLVDEYDRMYFVEIKTVGYAGDEEPRESHLDTLAVLNHELVFDDNDATTTEKDHDYDVIDDTQEKDSVVTTTTWKDGHSENNTYSTMLNRYIKNIERREVIVDNLDGQTSGSSFADVKEDEQMVRNDDLWTVYGVKGTLTKNVSVGTHTEEVTYTYYQERAVFHKGSIVVEFPYKTWDFVNFNDDFKVMPITTKDGYDMLTYTNELKSYYSGYAQMSNEIIDWFKKADEPIVYEVLKWTRYDYTDHTHVYIEKGYKKDGVSYKTKEYTFDIPIKVTPQSNWTINTDVYGTYVADELKESKPTEVSKKIDNLSYTQYTYTCTNNVSGKVNKFTVSVPNDIIFDDGEVSCKIDDSELKTGGIEEKTVKSSEDDEKTTYAYTYTAGVTFGDSSQEVDLPGTIIVAKEKPEIKVLKGIRTDYPSHSHFYIEKGYYKDGNPVVTEKVEENIPVVVTPLTNWFITTDIYGVYTSDEFFGNQTGQSSETTAKFRYNRYTYTYTNNVSGKENKFTVSVPNDVVYDDGEVSYTFSNSDLNTVKKNDNIVKTSEDEEKTVYAYTCTAGVSFGNSSQDVVLPGTVNVLASNTHEHGKITAVYFTSSLSENRSYWKNVCVIAFEDGYRSVGMADNSSNSFDFSMSSWNSSVNSAVYADGSWMPAQAADQSKCMKWWDENGTKREVLDYISTTAWGWNNGHNTVVDVRRSAGISASGYSVTLYLNGIAGQTLKF